MLLFDINTKYSQSCQGDFSKIARAPRSNRGLPKKILRCFREFFNGEFGGFGDRDANVSRVWQGFEELLRFIQTHRLPSFFSKSGNLDLVSLRRIPPEIRGCPP
jgi:hypothetical protein